MAQPKVICSIAYLKKRSDITLEEFYHHWENVHGPLVKPWMEKHGFVSYTQVHSTTILQQNQTASVGPQTSGPNPLLEYDGTAVIEAHSLDVLTTAFSDEYYKTVIAPDEDRFLDKKAGVLRSVGETKRILKVL